MRVGAHLLRERLCFLISTEQFRFAGRINSLTARQSSMVEGQRWCYNKLAVAT